MNFKEYQEKAHATADYPMTQIVLPPDKGTDNMGNAYVYSTIHDVNFIYPAMGIMGEAGEVGEKLKKVFRNKNGKFEEEDIKSISKELGDVMWYIAEIASLLNLNLEDIAKENIEKLESRYERNKIKSEGDDR